MRALGSVRFAIAVAVAATMAGFAVAGEPSGIAIAVVQQANIDGATGLLVLQPEAPVFSGDRIETGPVGEAQIKFRDDTRLVVGPKSSMVIDAFIFNDDDTAREFSINVVKGAFRFITGKSSKDAYTITTPTSTIGVRGTELDVSVEGATGITRVVNFEGEVQVCRRLPDGTLLDPTTNCIELLDPCTLTVARPRTQLVRYTGDDVEFRNRQLKYYFPYVRSQDSLLEDFRVDVDQCQIAGLPSSSPPEPPGPPPPEPPVPPEPPIPPPPEPPDFTPPPGPTFENRHPPRPVYDHGPVFRSP
jgi:hypothetical protein